MYFSYSDEIIIYNYANVKENNVISALFLWNLMGIQKIDNDKLIEMFNKGISYKDMAKYFNVTKKHVSSKLNRLGYTRAYKPWTKEDKDKAILLHNQGHTYSEIGKELSRTVYSIQKILYDSGNRTINKKHWTDEDVEYLLSKIGSTNFDVIEKKLKRTKEAIRQKLLVLGITSIINNSGMISLNRLSIITRKSGAIIKRWINSGLLKAKKSNIIKRSHVYLIDIDNFWKFAEKNKDKLKFSLIDKNILLPEPEWVERERIRERNDNSVYYHKNWTKTDMEYAMFLHNAGHKYKDIGKKMGRTERAVIGKIHRMKIRK